MQRRRGPNLARAVGLGAVVSLLTLVGHSLGARALPDPIGLFVMAALLTAMSAAISSARPRLGVIASAMIGGQLLGHLILAVTQPHLGHGGGLLPDAPMFVFHVVAAIAAGGVFLRVESLAERWRGFLHTILGAHAPESPPAATPWVPSTALFLLAPRWRDLPLGSRAPPLAIV